MFRSIMVIFASLFAGAICAEDFVTSVTARQIQPWNGLVEITVGLSCGSNDLAEVFCTFAATNSATRAALPVLHVRHVGRDTGSEREWQRHFIWDAAADLGEAKIDDVALTVDAQGPVQLWENGPYWAPCNAGATKPEECGYFFWWGDTIGYKRNAANDGWISVKDGSSYSFSAENCPTYDKNISQLQSAGYIDATGNLVAAHDAATTYLGAPWRMPTDAEFSALVNNCTTTWTTRKGVKGRLVTGKGAYALKSIFLPAVSGDDLCGRYRSSTGVCYSDYCGSCCLFFNQWAFSESTEYGRYSGMSVRPVRGFVK